MKFKHRFNGKTIIVHCRKTLAEQAEGLLAKLEELDRRGPPLRDGSTIRFGWSPLTLHSEGDALVVHEPDFSRDPRLGQRPRIDETLQVLKEQAFLLHMVAAEGESAAYDSQVVIEKECLADLSIYLERSAPVDKRDSGWFIGRVSGKETLVEEDLTSLPVFELMRQRPGVMKALALPAGWMVVFLGDDIQAVFDERGEDRLALSR